MPLQPLRIPLKSDQVKQTMCPHRKLVVLKKGEPIQIKRERLPEVSIETKTAAFANELRRDIAEHKANVPRYTKQQAAEMLFGSMEKYK